MVGATAVVKTNNCLHSSSTANTSGVGTGGAEGAAAHSGPRRGGQCSCGPQARSGTREGLCRQGALIKSNHEKLIRKMLFVDIPF